MYNGHAKSDLIGATFSESCIHSLSGLCLNWKNATSDVLTRIKGCGGNIDNIDRYIDV